MFNQTNSYWSVIGCIAIFLFTWETSSTGMIPNGSCLLIGLPSGNQTWFILVWTGWTVSISRPIPSGPPCLMTHSMPRRQGAALRLQDIISLPLRNRPLIPTLWILDTNKKPSFSEETTWMWTQDLFLFDKYMNIYMVSWCCCAFSNWSEACHRFLACVAGLSAHFVLIAKKCFVNSTHYPLTLLVYICFGHFVRQKTILQIFPSSSFI